MGNRLTFAPIFILCIIDLVSFFGVSQDHTLIHAQIPLIRYLGIISLRHGQKSAVKWVIFILGKVHSLCSMEAMSRTKQETLLLEERIEKIRKRNEELKRRHLVSLFYPTNLLSVFIFCVLIL
jgi:hypothetical protein